MDKQAASKQQPKEDRFMAFKVSLCGNQIRRDIVRGLSLQQAREYPVGRQKDAVGPFVWQYSLAD
jgi:hypothetical protein